MLNRLERYLPNRLSERERAAQLLNKKVARHPDLTEDDIGNLLDAYRRQQEKIIQPDLSQKEIDLLRKTLPTGNLDEAIRASVQKLSFFLHEQEAALGQQCLLKAPSYAGRLASFREGVSRLDGGDVATALLTGSAGLFLVGLGSLGLYDTLTHLNQLNGASFITGGFFTCITVAGGTFTYFSKLILTGK